MEKIKHSIRSKPLIWYCCILIAVKMAIAGGLFICASHSPHDDELGVDIAYNLLNGNWLGAYDNRRLVKGITFPLFLAINHLIGIPYTITLTLLYGMACMAVVKLAEKFIKNNIVLAALFTILYFIPASTGVQTFSRVYRSTLTCTLTLLVFVSFAQLYFNRRQKSALIWAFASGISLALFWNLREDSMWILPFVLTVLVIIVICSIVENKKEKIRWSRIRILYPVLPLMILVLCNTGIRAANYHYYGTFIRNELTEGKFPELLKKLYRIEPEEDIAYTAVPRSTIEKLYEVSPTFYTLHDSLDANYYAGWDGTSGILNGELENGWFMWCLRDCIFASGYDMPAEINAFCEQTINEIQYAFETDQLTQRQGIGMPSALMIPWKEGYAAQLPSNIGDAFWYMATHEGDVSANVPSSGSMTGISIFEIVTHNIAFKAPAYSLEMGGWIVSMSDDDLVSMRIYQGDTLITELQRLGGEDVYNAYAAQGKHLENALNSRFHATLSLESTENLLIAICRNGEIIDWTPIADTLSDTGYGYDGAGFHWHLDYISISSANTALEKTAAPRVAIFNSISSLYHASGKWVTMLSLFCYIVFTVFFLYEVFRKKIAVHLDEWLILSGLIGSVFVLCIGIGYTETSAYNAINATYTSGGKVLLLAFNLLSILFLGKAVLEKLTQTSKNIIESEGQDA